MAKQLALGGGPLVNYEAMCLAIAAALEVDELKDIRDEAALREAAARIAGNTDAEDRCYEIRRRAERRLGELMAKQAKLVGKAKGGQPHQQRNVTGSRSDPVAPTLAEAGIDKHLADNARKLANVPAEQFDAAFVNGGRPTVAEITGKKPPPERTPESSTALWVWGRVVDFERNGTLATKPSACLRELHDYQVEDVQRLAPQIVDWLNALLALAREQ